MQAVALRKRQRKAAAAKFKIDASSVTRLSTQGDLGDLIPEASSTALTLTLAASEGDIFSAVRVQGLGLSLADLTLLG